MKTKVEYLDALEIELKYLRTKVRKIILERYMNKINVELDFGIEETRIIEKLPHPSSVAAMIYKEQGIDLSKRQNQSMTTYALVSTIIGSIVFILLISATIISYIYFFSVFLSFLTLFKEVWNFELLDALISTLNFTVFLCLSLFVAIFIYELFIYLLIEILERILLAYPNIDKKKFEFLGKLSIIKYINQIFHKVEKIGSKTVIILILLFITLSTMSFMTKGYMFRVLMDLPNNSEEFIVDSNSRTTFNVTTNIDEVKWVVKQSEGQDIIIEYIYEFNRNFEYYFIDDTLHVKLDSQRKYDLFDLLKEPTHQIILHLPANIQIDQFKLTSNQSSLRIGNQTVTQIDYVANRGQLLFENGSVVQLNAIINSGAIQINESNVNSLEITVESAAISINKTTFNTAIIHNQYGKIRLEELNGTTLELNNGGGKSELYDSSIDDIMLLSRNGTIKIQNGVTDLLHIETIATNQIDIYQGTYRMISIQSEKGAVSIEDTTIIENVSIIGTDFFISIIDSTMTQLYTETIGGAVGIRDAQIGGETTIRLNQGDITIVNLTTPMFDTSLVRGIVSFTNLYADHIKVYMESGDFSYENDDLSHIFGTLDIVTNQANRRINVGS